jgi:GDP-D-mannose 3', 5'-epimerase
MKTALVCGAGGFIGSHLVRRLKDDGLWVRGVDRKRPEFEASAADEFLVGDLRNPSVAAEAIDRPFDEVYQLAAEMGGVEYTFAGSHDADIMSHSALININVLEACRSQSVRRVFFSSSACIYPERNQLDPLHPNCAEDTAYPADPDSEYGWEKLFAERLYLTFARCTSVETRIARYHNVFGPYGTWKGGREKAPSALCRKVAMAADGDAIEIIGDGTQSRSFLYVSEAVEGTVRLMRSDVAFPVNIGSDELITINDLASLIIEISGKSLERRHVAGPTGVRGRNSDNRLIQSSLGWAPSQPLRSGLEQTYHWIAAEVAAQAHAA